MLLLVVLETIGIENTDGLQSRDFFDGGPGDDILHTDHGTQTFYRGGSGSDIFVWM